MMPRHLRRSCLASTALLTASLVLAGVVIGQYLALQEQQNAWIDYHHQVQQQRPQPVWLSAQDQTLLKQLAQRGTLQPINAEAVKDELARLDSPLYQVRNERVEKPEPLDAPRGHWRLYATPLEFEVWLQHEEAFSDFWARLHGIPGWLDLTSCQLKRSEEEQHPTGIVMHCAAKLLGFGPDYHGRGEAR